VEQNERFEGKFRAQKEGLQESTILLEEKITAVERKVTEVLGKNAPG